MKKLFFLAFLAFGFCGNAQFTKVMDLSGTLIPNSSVQITEYNIWNGKVFYYSRTGNDLNIIVSDGTQAGTTLLKTIPNPTDAMAGTMNISAYKPAGNGIYINFSYLDSATYLSKNEIWFSDGTESNTIKITGNARIHIGGLTHAAIQNYQRPNQPSHIGNTFYFWRGIDNEGTGTQYLWKSDGTAAGTQQVTSAAYLPYTYNGMTDEYFDAGIAYNGDYYFLGTDTGGVGVRNKLFKLSNGTTPEVLGTFSEVLRMGTVFKNKIYFVAKKEMTPNSGYHEREIWQSDGTEAGTVIFKNFPGNNGGDGVDAIEHFTFQKNSNYMLIRTNDNLIHNIYATDGNPNNLYLLYQNSTYPVKHFYIDDEMAYFLRESNQYDNFNSFAIRFSDMSKTTITKPFYNTGIGTTMNGTLWISNKPNYNSAIYTPWRSTGRDESTMTSNSFNYSANFFKLNGVLYGISSYLGVLYTALYRFDADFTFANTSGDNSWNNPNNWAAKTLPLDFDDANIPSSQSPEINGNAFAKNLDISSPINLTTGNLNIFGNLNLSAKVTLNDNNLNLKGNNSEITNGNSSNYIVTNGIGTVNVENLNSNRGNISLPIGTAANYNPVTINNSGTSDTFSARVSDGISNTTNGAVNTTWEISEAVSGGSNVGLTLGWNGLQENGLFNRNVAKVGHFANGNWSEENSGSVSGSNPYTISASGITSFSPFSVMNFATLGLQEILKKDIIFYPNPTKDFIHFSEEIHNIKIADISGRTVKEVLSSSKSVNLESLPKGIYIITATTKAGKAINQKIFRN